MSDPTIPRPTERLALFACAVIGVAAIAIAVAERFVLDDAFISFAYARNLVEGSGLTWFGERVEGYTNFLWVLWIAGGMALGLDPVDVALATGLVAFAWTIAATYAAARQGFDDPLWRVVAVVALCCNYSVLAFATGGLETMAQAAAVATGLVMLGRTASSRRPRVELVGLSLVAAAAVLLRLDSAVPFAVILAAALVRTPRPQRAAAALALLAPVATIVGAWLAWRYSYYGSLVPNTFHAKVDALSMLDVGARQVAKFLGWYLIGPVVLAGIVAAVVRRFRPAPLPALAALVSGAWFAYVVAVGGDFMEFRMMVPAMPALALVVAESLRIVTLRMRPASRLGVTGLAAAVLVAASAMHAAGFRTMEPDFTLDSVEYLRTFYGLYPDGEWSSIGGRLGEHLEGTGASIAVHPAGAIPYFSRLATVDMWGLNDREIARYGTPAPAEYRRPGHRRHATLEYLRRRRVSFVIGQPTPMRRGALGDPSVRGQLVAWLDNVVTFNREPIADAVLVAIPLNDRDALLMWYLHPTEAVDRRIAERGWEALRIARGVR